MPQCYWCDQELTFVRWRGWVHPEGGAYMMICPDCGWRGAPYPSPMDCPRCDSHNLRSEHCVYPVSEIERKAARWWPL